jgi:UDP-N-acetylmuramate dehydrogenase
VIKISLQGINLRKDIKETVVEAAAGENWHRLVKFTLARNLYGLENLALIPGSVGAAPVQNIGAYGVELSDVLEGVNVLDRVTAQLQTLSREECELGYRHSIFKTKQSERYIITAIRLKLTEKSRLHTEYGAIRNELQEMGVADVTGQDIYQAVCRVRRRRLPDPEIHANVGSFFKNPIVPSSKYSSLQEQYPEISGTPFGDRVKVSAAWLIENSQLKGIREGGAQVSEQHSLVLINTGGASPADFLRLKDRIQSTLRDQYGLDLEVEPSVISP